MAPNAPIILSEVCAGNTKREGRMRMKDTYTGFEMVRSASFARGPTKTRWRFHSPNRLTPLAVRLGQDPDGKMQKGPVLASSKVDRGMPGSTNGVPQSASPRSRKARVLLSGKGGMATVRDEAIVAFLLSPHNPSFLPYYWTWRIWGASLKSCEFHRFCVVCIN